MEKKVLSFEDFASMKSTNTDSFENSFSKNESHEQEKNYMFFQNLNTIKHYLDEILAMDKSSVDSLLSDGHDWAADHIATSKDDLEEVCNWLRSEIESGNAHNSEAPEIEDEPEVSTDLEMIDGPDLEGTEIETEIEDEEDENDEEDDDEEEEYEEAEKDEE